MLKVHFITQGCSNNQRESEIMMGLLDKNGYQIDEKPENSDINVINICTVKGDNTALREIRRLKRDFPDKKLVVAGCITESIMPKIEKIDENVSLVNTHNFDRIADAVQNGNARFLDKKYELKVNLPSIRKNPVVGITPILNGCNYFCTFCSTKLIKGKLFSYPMKDIREDVKNHLKNGCREIWITSADTGAYMIDKYGKSKLVELLELVLSIPVDFKLRLGMMNPGNTIGILDDLMGVYKNEKMYKFLHIPVQSGNNEILKMMNRRYDVSTYKGIITRFREEIPEITISTDVIAGFPNEKVEQFNDTLDLIKETKPDVLNLSMYREREGTIAAKMKQVPESVRKERSRLLTKTFEDIALERNKNWIGWTGKILINEKGRNETWVGRNYCYKQVIVGGNFQLGQSINVKIIDATKHDLRGIAIQPGISIL